MMVDSYDTYNNIISIIFFISRSIMSFTTYISIDVATKSLAIGLYTFRSFKNLKTNMPDSKDILACNDYCNETFKFIDMNVYDINDGEKTKDTTVLQKAQGLKNTLNSFDEKNKETINKDNVIVLIEYQMNANHTSNAIFNMIMYHYAGRYPIHIVKPSLKNTIAFHPRFVLAEFLAHASTNYKANKQHTTYNMIYLLTLYDSMHLISSIKKKNHDDIADTLCQAVAWHKVNGI